MLKNFLKKYGVINSTIIITLMCVVASVAISLIVNGIIGSADLRSTLTAAVLCPLIIAPFVIYFYARLTIDLDISREELKKSNNELSTALADVKTLTGLLPICWSCRKIRDDKGYWNQLEDYISDRSNACFVRGLCEDCAQNSSSLTGLHKYKKP